MIVATAASAPKSPLAGAARSCHLPTAAVRRRTAHQIKGRADSVSTRSQGRPIGLTMLAALLALPLLVLAASYSASFTDSVSSANVGDTFSMDVQITNSSGTGSGTASLTLSYDTSYYSTDSATKTCSFGGGNTCTASWSMTALKSGTPAAISVSGSAGSDSISSVNHGSITITAPTSYTLTFTDNDADNTLTASQSVSLSLTVSNSGNAASATATLSLTGLTLTSGSSSVSLGSISEGGQASTSWTVQHDGTSSTASATVSVTGGDSKSGAISFTGPSSSSSSGSSTGGGGGGGGGGGSGGVGVTTEPGKVLLKMSSLPGNSVRSATFEAPELAVVAFNLLAANPATNVLLTIQKVAEPGVAGPEGTVYEYFQVDKVNITDADIKQAYLGFKVPKSWLDTNGIDKSTVKLQRRESGNWKAYDTTIAAENSNSYTFNATLPGFSLFAITGTPGTLQPAGQGPGQPSPGENPVESAIKEIAETIAEQPPAVQLTGGIIAIALAAALALFIYRRMERKKGTDEASKKRK